LLGFKSFGKNTTIDVREGATSIVGPNGCGKTNVADGIRWVLGEQRLRSLRSEKLEDVIFHGTGRRKPLGMAEVELVLSDAEGITGFEGSELSIQRRAYRDGSSRFFLNRQPVRLKDITELLMGTGLGVDGYAVIEGKMIEAILLASPDERRSFFEEAAGISRYKTKRRSAELKLDAVHKDIVRIGDIIVEVEKNVRSLKYQVGRAKRYKNIRERWEKTVIDISALRFKTLNTEKEELSANIRELEDGRTALESESRGIEAEIEAAKLEEIHRGEELSRFSALLREEARNLQRIESDIDLCRERRKQKAETVKRLEGEAATLEEMVTRQKYELGSLKEEGDRHRQRSTQIRDELSGVEEEIDGLDAAWNDAQERLATARSEFAAEERERMNLESEKATLSALVASGGSRLAALRKDIDETVRTVKEQESKADSIEELVRSAEEETESLNLRLAALSEEKENLTGQLADTRALLVSESVEKKRLESSLVLLEELERAREGVWKGSGKALDLLPANKGTVASHVDDAGEIAGALDHALAARLQAVIFEEPTDLLEGIRRAVEEDWGAAVFYSSSIASEPPEPVVNDDRVLGLASDLVKSSSEPVRSLLSRILVVEDEKTAADVIKGSAFQGIVITKTGLAFSPDGLVRISIRQREKGAGLLERRDRIAAERKELTYLEERAEEYRVVETELNEHLASVESERTETASLLSSKQTAILELQSEFLQAVKDLGNSRSRVDTLRIVEAETESELVSAREKLDQLSGKFDQAGSEDNRTLRIQREIEEELAGISPGLDDAKKRRSVLSLEQARLEERLVTVGRDSERLQKRSDRDQAGIAERRRQIVEMKESRKTLEDEISSLEKEFESASQSEEQRAEIHRKAEEEWRGVRDRIQENQNRVSKIRKETSEKSERIHDFEIRVAEIGMELKQLLHGLRDDLGKEPEELHEIEPERDDLEALEAERRRLQSSMEKIGAVGSYVLEQYDEESKRLEFMSSQRDDLVEAREKLLATIRRINSDARKRFVETFETMRLHFAEVFSVMFEGGEADIVLESDVDPLEAGIEIFARPAGKRALRLSLLSSGEKALTAISLLFAAFLCRPSPFCLLDEVDAPLDDANVHRFLRLLDRFKESTQFLLISHNKVTIKSTDTIIGVTMQEPGISSVIGVNLDSVDEILEKPKSVDKGGEMVPEGRLES